MFMKATGIVRRIDELGRVVIPKEIRRTLRIKEGDPLEIFTDRDELMLKKYSPIATIERFSEATARSLNDLSGKLAVICDTDGVLHAYGDGKRELDGKNLSDEMDRILKERRSYVANAAEGGDILPLTAAREEGVTAQVIVPIVSGGDCLGAVAVLSKEEGAKLDQNIVNLARLTADILANQFD
ncbi:MAG: AbrB/MazE/SpoVT family DNA-binding domain-containing protein [Clostridia bacterium]|nr:AbrB/MazE/SpoVT family DNA-binding domain-containing protein [Clostridia bacterium]